MFSFLVCHFLYFPKNLKMFPTSVKNPFLYSDMAVYVGRKGILKQEEKKSD